MADLYNEKTGVIERNIPSDEVDKRILTGSYGFPGDAETGVYVGTTSGKAMRVSPALAADYIRAGSARYLKPSVAQGMMDNEEFAGSLMGQLAAIPYGMEDYLGAGIFSSIGESLGVAEGQKEAVQAQNPWTWHTSGIVPSAMAAFLSGGLTGIGQVGAQGLKQGAKQAVKETLKEEALEKAGRSFAAKGIDAGKTFLRDYTLPGIGGKLAAKVQGKTFDGLMEHGHRFVPATIGNAKLAKALGPQAAKVISGGIAASVENGVWGAGEGVSEAMLGDPAEAAEHIFNTLGTNMAIGLGVGGAVSAAIPMLTGAAGLGAKGLSKIIDFQSLVGGKVLDKSEAFIRAVGKRNRMTPEQIDRMVETLTGEDGPELMRQMADLKTHLDKHAGATTELVDAVLLTDDFVQLSDISGFSREALIDLIRATKSGHSIDYSISRFEADPVIRKIMLEIDELEKKTRGQGVLPGVVDELNAKKAQLEDLRASYLDENRVVNFNKEKPGFPEDPLKALDEGRIGIDVATKALRRLERQFEEIKPSGVVDKLIDSFEEREREWYRQLLSEDVEASVMAKHRLNNPTPKPLTKAEERVHGLWEEHWADFNDAFIIGSERAEFRKLAPILKKLGIDPDAVIKSAKKGDITEKGALIQAANDAAALKGRPIDLARVLEEIRHASAIAADTGDASQLMAAYKRYGATPGKPKGITQKRFDALKQRAAPWGGAEKEARIKASFAGLRKELSKKRAYLGEQDYYPGEPHFTDFRDVGLRERVAGFLSSIDAVELPDSVLADSFKVLEDIQTSILKNIQYGLLPAGGGIEKDLKQNVIDILRTMMEDESKWGLMATQKKRFNKLSFEFQTKRGQILTDLTEKDGTAQRASASKIMSLFNKLDSETSATMKSRLGGYVSEGKELLEFIRTNFEPVDFADLLATNPQALGAIEERLTKIDIQAALKARGRPVKPRQPDLPDTGPDPGGINKEWDDRLKELQYFVEQADIDMQKAFKYIQEELPLAKALTSEGARQQNLNNAVSDLGRGGAASAFTYLLTSSPAAAGLVGLGVGSISMALDPVRLMSFVNQLRIAKGASQDVIGEYLEDWLTKKLPKAAIHKNWEKNARQMFMIGAQASRRDIKESKTEVRKKIAKNRSANAWSERIQASLDSTLTGDNYFDASNAFTQLVSSTSVMERFLEDSTKIFENTPDLRQAMSDSLRTRIQYAHRIMPQATGGFLNKPIPPSRIQLDQWGTALQVLNSPTDVMLTALMTGSITEEMVTTLKEGWPRIYAEISQKVMELVNEPGKLGEITQEQKTSISILLGLSSIGQDELAQLNKTWAREDKQKQGSQGSGIRNLPQQYAGDATSVVERPRV